jgi:hypothetical protein
MLGRERIYQLITEIGFYDAEKITGLKIYDLIRISGYPMNCDIAGLVIYELLKDKKLPESYNEFEIEVDYDGVTYWTTKGDINVYVMATPFWDGQCHIPIDIDLGKYDEDGDEIYIGGNFDGSEIYHNISLNEIRFKTIENLLKWYKDFYLPKTYEVIKTKVDEYTDVLMKVFNKSKGTN